ncbi:hypothetical protein L211DRAFT_836502 [Terfezia boudieri ATCC MYA-4762]|uniref:Uncharacterized protein n=1 Tax=Terfezia boudieri ATCC MYA-4762 TaxID=1051890 RepID=A0A3N4LUE8_9PEZI|nr:hypothetical protein L211DRAFT_836502 [Terfezia boudieri ATCC MYA-4762]
MLSCPNSSAEKSVPAINVTGCEANGASLAYRELQVNALSPSGIDNQLDNSGTELLLAIYEGDSAEGAPDETFTRFISNYAIPEFEELTELVHQGLEPRIAPFPANAPPLTVGSMEPQTRMKVPEMLSRFLEVDRLNDSLRYEAEMAIFEGRVQQGENMLSRRILEEHLKWNTGPQSTAMGVNTPTEWSNGVEKDCMKDHCMEDGCMEDGCMEDGCIAEECMEDRCLETYNCMVDDYENSTEDDNRGWLAESS